jgi:hypothetical protein
LEFEVAVLQLPVPPFPPPPFLLRSLRPSEPEKEFRREPEAEEFPLWLPLFFSPGRLDRVVLSLNNTDFKLIIRASKNGCVRNIRIHIILSKIHRNFKKV